MSVVIKVENLSKQYRLGTIGTGTIAHDAQRWWAEIRGKEDPFLKIGEENKRDEKGVSDYVWSLKDINFEVHSGEALGIIGRNGAGKSTLLKILSKVTSPTTGSVKIKGRVASLLEVGTGFHPELTGRENVFLNGAILGMSKNEIKNKFDEILDFSGVEKYIDTPVKRYSSGMYVRLAFGVAAHLEPEILIVDEVLAVGDAEFQKKCLGKMKDVSGEGRTVIFVSHNMGAIASLCKNSILLEHGKIIKIGESENVITTYLRNFNDNNSYKIIYDKAQRPGDEHVKLNSVRLIDENENDIEALLVSKKFGLEITYEIIDTMCKPGANFLLSTNTGEKIFQSLDTNNNNFLKGIYRSVCWFPSNLLNDQGYILNVALTTHNPVNIHASIELNLEVIDDINAATRGDYKGKMHGSMRPLLTWETKTI